MIDGEHSAYEEAVDYNDDDVLLREDYEDDWLDTADALIVQCEDEVDDWGGSLQQHWQGKNRDDNLGPLVKLAPIDCEHVNDSGDEAEYVDTWKNQL